MSFPAIILGFLVWFSLPPLICKGISEQAQRVVTIICKILGIAIVVGGILWNWLK